MRRKKAFIEPKIEKKKRVKESDGDVTIYGNVRMIYCQCCGNAIGAYDSATGDVFYDGHFCNMCGTKITQVITEILEINNKTTSLNSSDKQTNTQPPEVVEKQNGKIIPIVRKTREMK